jgi:two-component sensor histidine kinase
MPLRHLPERWLSFLPQKPVPVWRSQLIALSCVVVATAIRQALGDNVVGVPFITYFPALAVASVIGGSLAGVSTLIVSALIASYLYLPPALEFKLYYRQVNACIVYIIMGFMIISIVSLLHILLRQVKEAEEQAKIYASEMRHRIANVIGLVQAVSRMTARDSADKDDYQDKFDSRLAALARAQELAAPDPDSPTDLRELMRQVLEPFDLRRFRMNGPAAGVEHSAASMLALVVHELGTNAVKHGGLSVPVGIVDITWTADDEAIILEWQEDTGKGSANPARTGFGSRLLSSAFPPGRGETALVFEAGGLRYTAKIAGSLMRASAAERRGALRTAL